MVPPVRGDAADGSLEALREGNRLRVVDALRRSGTATRSELARMTGLSRTTVATLVGDLQTAGLVVGADDAESLARSGGRGRPPALLRLDASAGVALGIDLGHSHVRVAVADLSSALLGEADAPVDVDHDADGALDTASRLVDDVLAQAGVERDRVIGAGMGLPGPYDRGRQMVSSATILPGWVGRNAAEELGARIGVLAPQRRFKRMHQGKVLRIVTQKPAPHSKHQRRAFACADDSGHPSRASRRISNWQGSVAG